MNIRVDNSNIAEVARTNSRVEIKGNVDVAVKETTTKQVDKGSGEIRSIQQTTVEVPHISGESQLDEIRQEAENMEAQLLQKKMQVVANTATPADCGEMEEDGYSLNDTEVETVVTEMDKIKMELAKAGVDISVFGDMPDSEMLEAITGSVAAARQIESAIEEANLPATEENVTDIQETLKQAADLTSCSDEAVKYMLDNELEPTVENLYKAQHSSGTMPNQEMGIKLDDGLKEQISQVIKQAGLSVNDTTLSVSQWMMENQIPLTADNLNYVMDLKEAQLPPDMDQVMNAAMRAIAEGGRPKDAVIVDGYSNVERAQQAAQTIEQATDGDVWSVVEKGMPLTIENLEAARNYHAQQETDSRSGGQRAETAEIPEYAKEDLAFLKAKRQLEEIRLAMTAQANYALLRQGISIETQPLEELVQQLKEQENAYYASLLSQNGIEPTQENTGIFADTIEKTQQMKGVPAYILGNVKTAEDTINSIHEAGVSRQTQMERAGEAYEALWTAPRADLGDSIRKAFQNVDDILDDLDLEVSEANRRAVRILAYNEMAINPESIMQMKAADQKVQNLFQNLSPSVVMEMIREGVNPLEMNVEELNAKAEDIKNKLNAGDEEKFSKYLWKLEQHQEITEQERDSYIGIYRMLNQIDKTDGAVIGALVQQGAELSMKNLLTAVRTNHNSGIDVSVDNNFGEIESLNMPGLSITEQIEAAYQTDCAKEALRYATPEGMQQMQGSVQDMTPEELLWQLRYAPVDEAAEEAYYQEQLAEFSQAKQAEAHVLQILAGHDMPVTAYNIMAANQLLNPRGGIFKTLFEREGKPDTPDLEEAKEAIIEKFGEALGEPEDLAEAQQELAEAAENVMRTMEDSQGVTSVDLRDMRLLRQQIALGTRMAKDEHYAIPVLVGDELTNVQLKIVRGKEERGRVDVLFETPKLGKVAARFQVQEDSVKGYVVSDSNRTIEELKNQQDSLAEQFGLQEGKSPTLDFAYSEELDLNRFAGGKTGNTANLDTESQSYRVQTQTLYGLAKGFLEGMKQMGQSI